MFLCGCFLGSFQKEPTATIQTHAQRQRDRNPNFLAHPFTLLENTCSPSCSEQRLLGRSLWKQCNDETHRPAFAAIQSDPHSLLARNFAEAGVHYIKVGTSGWDHHFDIKLNLPVSCQSVDKPIGALLTDLL